MQPTLQPRTDFIRAIAEFDLARRIAVALGELIGLGAHVADLLGKLLALPEELLRFGRQKRAAFMRAPHGGLESLERGFEPVERFVYLGNLRHRCQVPP